MKNRLFNIFIIMLFVGSFGCLSAQTTIGSLNEPIKGALLDVKQENATDLNTETVKTGGMILPRVKLTNLKSLEPCVSESAVDYAEQKMLNVGLMVFNTTKDDAKSIYGGIYAWNGNEWQFMVSQASEFNLSVSPVNLVVESGIDGQVIKDKSISVSWRPIGSNCTVEAKAILNGGVAISNLPTALPGGSGNATISISKNDITPLDANDILVNPFLEKQSTLSIIVSDGTETRTEKVTITQRHNTLIVRNMPTEVELGEDYVVRLVSNTDWEAVASDAAIQITTPAGGSDVLGSDFKFKVSDLTADEGKDVTITFTNPDGKFPSQVFTLRTFREYPNAYIVNPGEVLQLPVAKAFVVAQEVFGEDLTGGAFTAELLWQDRLNDAKTEGLITAVSVPGNAVKSSFITVTTNTGTMTDILTPSLDPADNIVQTIPMKGNAVVALKRNGEIVWNWHIWVTDYNPDEALDHVFKVGESDAKDVTGGKVVSFFNTAKSTILMDRDLGSGSGDVQSDLFKGLNYQWGRKDPMAGGTSRQISGFVKTRPIYDMNRNVLTEQVSALTPAVVTGLKKIVVSGTGTYLKRSIQEPLTMFVGLNDNAHDWYSAETDVRDNTLWNSAENNKTYYDPCPKGWRIPIGGFGTESVYFSIPARMPEINLNNQYFDYMVEGLGCLPYDFIRTTANGILAAGSHISWHGATIAAFSYQNTVSVDISNVAYPKGRTIAASVRCVKEIKNK